MVGWVEGHEIQQRIDNVGFRPSAQPTHFTTTGWNNSSSGGNRLSHNLTLAFCYAKIFPSPY